MKHRSVLLQEAIDGLELKEGDIYLDATAGSGGHLREVAERFKGKVELVGIDLDENSIELTRTRLAEVGTTAKLKVLSFREIDQVPELLKVGRPNKILFDLGWSKDQFEDGGRGFSFQKDEPLLMTFNSKPKESDLTAFEIVNDWSEESLADVIWGYGQEQFARRIANAIVNARAKGPIQTSGQLMEIIKSAVPIFYRFGRLHPATKTFQAIRIAVNDELNALEEGVTKAFEILAPQGRLAVISFHSLEDRIVKNFFKLKKTEGAAIEITKKPLIASAAEIKENPSSRSAKLRIIQKVVI